MAGHSPEGRPLVARIQLLAIGLLGLLLPIAAEAGPWTPRAGQGLSIISLALGQEGDGSKNWAKAETSFYIEQGLPEGAALIFAPSIETRLGGPGAFGPPSIGVQVVGIRTPRFTEGRWALATQVSAMEGRVPGSLGVDGLGRDLGLEARILGGRSIGASSFISVEGALRNWNGGVGEVRMDAALGMPLVLPHWKPGQVLFQVFAEAPLVWGVARVEQVQVRVQSTLLVPLAEKVSIQFGLRSTIASSGWRDQSLILGLWRRF